MLDSGGEPIRLAHRREADQRPRRVVLLIDVSGSMSPYADALLRFAHVGDAAHRQRRGVHPRHAADPGFPAAASARPGTRAARGRLAVPDFAGGTRLGETLRAFLDRWGQRGVARRAVVVVVLRRLGARRPRPARRAARAAAPARARRVLGESARRPCGLRSGPVGIVAALPHIDQLLAGHSLDTLERLLGEIRRCVTCWTSCSAAGRPARRSGSAPSSPPSRSAPRAPGAAMLVAPDGAVAGSVSGGCVEGAVYELAQQVVENASRCCSATASATTTRSPSA